MAALDHKFIFFVLIVHLAKTQPYDFKRDTVHNFVLTDSSTSQQQNIKPTNSDEIYTIRPEQFNSKPCIHHNLVFSFSDVGLQKIRRDFVNSDDIVSLSLDNNDINNISRLAFRSMRNLRYLNLSGNKIPKEKLLLLAENNKLQTLIIDNNNDSRESLTEVMTEYEVFRSLEYFHLRNSQLQNFQVPFYLAMPTLNHLYLSNNDISSSDAIFENIPLTLTHLYLNENRIDRVKQGKLRNLQELIMDNNVITQVCFEECQDTSISLKNAVRIQNLSLSRNLISEISPDAFSDTNRLLILDLSGNKIADMAKNIFNNTYILSYLSLADNILATIPNVCPLPYLKTLNLTGNRIDAILSDTFCNNLRTLEYLYLSNNVIITIESPAFFSLHRLKYLDLSGNQLRQLPAHSIRGFIQELHLERNNFTELHDISLINIKTLRNIYLDENPMPTLTVGSFQSLPEHLTVHLRNMRVEDKCTQCQCESDDDEDENNDENSDDNYNSDNSNSPEWAF